MNNISALTINSNESREGEYNMEFLKQFTLPSIFVGLLLSMLGSSIWGIWKHALEHPEITVNEMFSRPEMKIIKSCLFLTIVVIVLYLLYQIYVK